MKTSAGILALAALLGSAQAMLPIEIKGMRFIKPSTDSSQPGNEFTVIGVDYQPGGSSAFDVSGDSDVLTDADTCLRDAIVLQNLGVNCIRVYSVSPWLNHDECMSIFNAAGIYLILDVNNPYQALSRTDPESTYNEGYLNNVFGIIDAFKGYPNLLGFFSGNEVINDGTSAGVVPKYLRAVQRDMKQYIEKHANRTIPVGYSAADDVSLRAATWEYLQCGNDTSKSDFFGLNTYEWCSGVNDWQTSGYGEMVDTFNSTSIPLILSEYGCNTNSPRTFDEVSGGVYSGLNTTFSGGLVYEYSQETSDYGLVEIQDDGSIKFLDDYDNLKKQYQEIIPQLANTSASDISDVEPTECSADTISSMNSDFQTDMDLPDCPASDMLENGGGNQNIGKIVDVNTTESKYKIYDSSGDELTLSLNIDSSNLINSLASDNDADSSSSSSSKSAAAASTTASSTSKKNDGALVAGSTGFVAAVFGVVFALI